MDSRAAQQMDVAPEHLDMQQATPGTPSMDHSGLGTSADRIGTNDQQHAAPNPLEVNNVPAAERCLREPTPTECDAFRTLEDILKWARVPGDPTFPPSAAARLLELTGCMDDGRIDATIDDFASLTPDAMDTAIADWRYHRCPTRVAYEEQLGTFVDDAEYTEIPSPMLITRALMAHNAARIKAGRIWTRDARTSLQMAAAGVTFDAATNSYYKAPAPDARPEDDAPPQTARHTSLLPPPPPAAKRPRITDSNPPLRRQQHAHE